MACQEVRHPQMDVSPRAMRTTSRTARGHGGMRTTLERPDPLFARLKARAASSAVPSCSICSSHRQRGRSAGSKCLTGPGLRFPQPSAARHCVLGTTSRQNSEVVHLAFWEVCQSPPGYLLLSFQSAPSPRADDGEESPTPPADAPLGLSAS